MSGRRNPFRDGLFRLPGGQFSDFVFGQAENCPFVHRHGSERTVEGDRRCVPIQYDPLHPPAAPLGGELDQMKQQPFPVSAPSVLLIDVYVFQVETAIFLHIQRDGIWPNCYECQLWNGKAGDLIHSSGTESAELRADSTLIILPKLEPSTEKPVGEWNTAEIVCSDSTITVHVNGQLQNRLTGLSNRQGFIGLQSEGGPVQFRNIILTPLD